MTGRTHVVRHPLTEEVDPRAPAPRPVKDEQFLCSLPFPCLPNLKKWVERGAFSFTRAYSPSSGTMPGMASLMTMSYPHAAELETWMTTWHGRLAQRATTVAELLQKVDYSTFWLAKDYGFSENKLGLDQGFDDVQLLEGPQEERHTVDPELAKLADVRIRRAVSSGERFFGWVFFVSPHSPYTAADPTTASEDPHERYLQALLHMDQQFGRLLRTLEETGSLDSTIVIFTGDHGEEFGEHGGKYHKSTLYNEVTHVPLVVWLPNKEGRTIEEPTSTLWFWPWLLASADSAFITDFVERRISEQVLPLYRATDGAVISELIGHEQMLVSLVGPRHKAIYDYGSGLFDVYDTVHDPLDQRPLQEPELREQWRLRLDRYRQMRAGLRRYRVMPEYNCSQVR